MRKIIVGSKVSMDGIMQAPGGPIEDPTKGFKFGGWVMPYRSREGPPSAAVATPRDRLLSGGRRG
jgi:hypothetical protein